MSTLSVRVRYRPIRIGWCLQSESWEQYRTALRLTHAFAGGRFNPLIPVDQPDMAEHLVDCFKVDLLFPISDIEPITAFVDAHPHLAWPEHERRLFWDRWQDRPPYAAFVDVYHAARRINEEQIQRKEQPAVHASLVDWDDADPLRDVLLATVGSYAQPSRSMPDYRRLLSDALRAETVRPERDAVLPADLNTLMSPSRLTRYGLQLIGRAGDPGIYVGRADDFADVTNFWNLRASGTEVVFADLKYLNRLEPMIAAHRQWIETLLPAPGRARRDVTVWTQELMDGRGLEVIGPRLVRQIVSADSWDGLSLTPITPYWSERDVLASVDESGRTPVATLSLPEKPIYEEHFLHGQRIVASLTGFDRFLHERNVTFFPPYIPSLNRYYGHSLYHDSDDVRSESDSINGDGVAIMARLGQSDITLTSLSALDVMTRLFETCGVVAKPSRPGLVTSRLIAQMGGLQGCRVFKIAGVRKLVEMYSPEKHFDRGLANKVIGDFDEAAKAMRFQPFEDLYLGPRPHSRKLRPQDALDDLLHHKVFRVGLELKCPHCELPFWQPLDDLSTSVECQLCGSVFDITLQLRDRNWAYRRSGLFGRDDHQQGGIPVAVALQQLEANLHPRSGHGLLYTTCLNLTAGTAAIAACETDLAILTTGYSKDRRHWRQVVLGECKAAGGEITVADAQHLAQVADLFPKHRLRAFIVFAKTSTFLAAEIQAAAAAQHRFAPRVILLSKDELEPYDILDRHNEVERRFHSDGLEGLADFTVHRYPELRPPDAPPAPPARPDPPAPPNAEQ